MKASMSAGPVLIGISGTGLDEKSRQTLLHPAVGRRRAVQQEFHESRPDHRIGQRGSEDFETRLLVCIDQEGGRVQRLKDGFSTLPPLGMLGRMYAKSQDSALDLTYRHARVMAAEILACGIDLSFAPVLDLDRGSTVIGDRSFSAAIDVVVSLGRTYLAGMHDAYESHRQANFPGHGSVGRIRTHDAVDDRLWRAGKRGSRAIYATGKRTRRVDDCA
jgi:beta-N-acetylhexosaminidase